MSTLLHPINGQVVIVTGSGSGMGRATAIAAAAAGAHVVLAARRANLLAETGAIISAAGGMALAVPSDLTVPSDVRRLVDTALGISGRIDILVHAAGTNIKERAIAELTSESWAAMLDTNLTAAFELTHALVPVFRRQAGGLIVYVASSAAKKPDRSGIAYQASKAGLVGLAHGTMEEEREHGLRTSVIFPGFTDTPLALKRPAPTPPDVLARALQAEDVAAACLFVMGLPPRAHVPELVIYPSRL